MQGVSAIPRCYLAFCSITVFVSGSGLKHSSMASSFLQMNVGGEMNIFGGEAFSQDQAIHN